jgi:hypothetical protein
MAESKNWVESISLNILKTHLSRRRYGAVGSLSEVQTGRKQQIRFGSPHNPKKFSNSLTSVR